MDEIRAQHIGFAVLSTNLRCTQRLIGYFFNVVWDQDVDL